jgi:predicted GIY-YIG superfamily endonuclease
MQEMEIYHLSDPVSGEVFYVGMSNNAQKRKHTHFNRARRDSGSNKRLNARIRKIEKESKSLAMCTVLKKCKKQAAIKLERETIRSFIQSGHPLLNINKI